MKTVGFDIQLQHVGDSRYAVASISCVVIKTNKPSREYSWYKQDGPVRQGINDFCTFLNAQIESKDELPYVLYRSVHDRAVLDFWLNHVVSPIGHYRLVNISRVCKILNISEVHQPGNAGECADFLQQVLSQDKHLLENMLIAQSATCREVYEKHRREIACRIFGNFAQQPNGEKLAVDAADKILKNLHGFDIEE